MFYGLVGGFAAMSCVKKLSTKDIMTGFWWSTCSPSPTLVANSSLVTAYYVFKLTSGM